MESHNSSLHHVSFIMIHDLNVLRVFIEYGILCQLNPTLVVTIYHCRIQDMLKQLSKGLPQPYFLAASHASSNILYLEHAQTYGLFLPTHPRYHHKSQDKAIP